MKKLDPRLRYLIRQPTSIALDFSESVGFPQTAEQPSTVEVLVRCVADRGLEDLHRAGMNVHFATHGTYTVATGEVSLDNLEKLNELGSVERVEASRPMVAELDISLTETRTQPLHLSVPSVKGAGVIVGIVDGGIDYTHRNFRNEDGSSRILFLWDQGGPFDPNGQVPYGREYTKAELGAALASPEPFKVVPHRDFGGHGTHVAGIAAGNGTSNSAFTGIAPDADLIVVAYRSEGATLGRSTRALAAVTYIVQQANGRPVAINLSQGMNSGGHAGETVLETGLDNLVRQPNVVIVKSAGNEQDWRIHAGGQIAQGQMVALELLVQMNNREDDILEVWYDGTDQISIAMQPPGSAPMPFVTPSDQGEFDTQAGNHISVDFDLDSEGTGDTCATIILSRGNAAFIQPGTWNLLLRGDRVSVGRYDAWIERTRRDVVGEQIRFTEASADNTRTISIPGTAKRIITVGCYVTRPEAGISPPHGQISLFSSRGPTRYGLQKPEIAAPGEMIISTRSSTSRDPETPDQWHTTMAGTSMAAPQVTGAVALILSLRQDLTCEQVKQVLMQTARRDGFASSAPDHAWGSGKLNVEAAIERARTVRFPQISNVQVNVATLSWQTDILTTSAVRFHTHKRQLQLGKNLRTQVDLTLRTNHTLTLSGLSPGRYYCEILAFSQDNWWTEEDQGGEFFVVDIPQGF